MVYAQVLEAFIHFALMYTSDRILPVIPIKYLINEDGESTTPFKLAIGTELSISHLCVLFFACVVRKAHAYFGTKSLKMLHQAQKGFCGISIGIPHHQKGYIVYLPHKHKIISSYDVNFYEIFSSGLEYTSQQYAESMAMKPGVLWIPYATYSKRKNSNIITFTQFEEGVLLLESCNGMRSGDKSDEDLNLPALVSEAESDESDYGPMPMDML